MSYVLPWVEDVNTIAAHINLRFSSITPSSSSVILLVGLLVWLAGQDAAVRVLVEEVIIQMPHPGPGSFREGDL